MTDNGTEIPQIPPEIGEAFSGLLAGNGHATETEPGASIGVENQRGNDSQTAKQPAIIESPAGFAGLCDLGLVVWKREGRLPP